MDKQASSKQVRTQKDGNFFPNLPAYTPPRTGLLAWLPPSLHPYLQVMRLDRPKPAIYFYLPHLIGSLQAGIILATPPVQLLKANFHLLVGTFFLRGATCTWNDMVDVEIDKRVERTRHRPLARGALSLTAAGIFMIVQSACAFGVLAFMPRACSIYAIPGIVGWILYPLAKRVTNYPQVVLGFPMAWGVFMGAAAVGAEPLRLDQSTIDTVRHMANPVMAPQATQAVVSVFISCALWTLCYETVYSYQDVRDDVAAGVKNIALLLRDRAKPFLGVISAADVILLFYAGHLMDCAWPYTLFTVIAKTAALSTKIASVNLSNPADCQWWFRDGGYITGGVLAAGFALEYARRVLS